MILTSDYVAQRSIWIKKNRVKIIAALVMGASLTYGSFELMKQRGTIGFHAENVKCIEGLNAAWISYNKPTYDDIRLNDIISIDGSAIPGYKQGQLIVKIVKAKEGDLVEVSSSRGGVWINDVFISSYLNHAKTPIEAKGKVPPGKLFLMGNTADSFDSRYFGPVDYDKVIGYAYEIF